MRAISLLLTGAAIAATAPPAGATAPVELRPDLRAAAPSRLTILSQGPVGARRHLLGFRSAAENVGRGPLLIEGRRPPGRSTMVASQRIAVKTGRSRRVDRVGRLRFVRSPDHSHWHLLRFMRYELRALGGTSVAARDQKLGFCLGDRFGIGGRPLRGAPPQAAFTSNCGLRSPRLRSLREGISVGYGDDYPPHLEGQNIDITGLPPGRYTLTHRVNADRALREVSYANNRSSLEFALMVEGGVPRLAP